LDEEAEPSQDSLTGTLMDVVIEQFNKLKLAAKIGSTMWFVTEDDRVQPVVYWERLRNDKGYFELSNTMLYWLAWTGTATIDRADSLLTHMLQNVQRLRMTAPTLSNEFLAVIHEEWLKSELMKTVS